MRPRLGLYGRKKRRKRLIRRPKDPDVEDAPVVPEMGTIDLRAYRTRAVRTVDYQTSAQNGLHQGRVSERSKKAGWHHVR